MPTSLAGHDVGVVLAGPPRGALLNKKTKVRWRLFDKVTGDFVAVATDYSSAKLYVADKPGGTLYLDGITVTLGTSPKGLLTCTLTAAQVGSTAKLDHVYDLELTDSDSAILTIRGLWNSSVGVKT